MLNENKVKMMTKMAIYEKTHDKELICHEKYYKSDYVTFGMLKSMIAATFAFILLAAVYVLCNLEYLVANINNLDYGQMGLSLAKYYISFILLYGVISFFVYSHKYEKSRSGVKKYVSRLNRLERFYNSQKK